MEGLGTIDNLNGLLTFLSIFSCSFRIVKKLGTIDNLNGLLTRDSHTIFLWFECGWER